MSANDSDMKKSETPKKQQQQQPLSYSQTSSEIANDQAMSNYFDYNDPKSPQLNQSTLSNSQSSNQSEWSNVSQLTEDITSSQQSQSQNNAISNNNNNNNNNSENDEDSDTMDLSDNDIENDKEGSFSMNKQNIMADSNENETKTMENSENNSDDIIVSNERIESPPSSLPLPPMTMSENMIDSTETITNDINDHINDEINESDTDDIATQQHDPTQDTTGSPEHPQQNSGRGSMESSLGYHENRYLCGNTPGNNKNNENNGQNDPIGTNDDTINGENSENEDEIPNNSHQTPKRNNKNNKKNGQNDRKNDENEQNRQEQQQYAEEGQQQQQPRADANDRNNRFFYTLGGILTVLVLIVSIWMANSNNNSNNNTQYSHKFNKKRQNTDKTEKITPNNNNNNANNQNNNAKNSEKTVKNTPNNDEDYANKFDFIWQLNEAGEPIMPQFECPLTDYYVSINKESFSINAKQSFDNETFYLNPNYDISYIWDIEDIESHSSSFEENIMLDDETSPLLMMYGFDRIGTETPATGAMKLALYISVTIRHPQTSQNYNFATKCPVNIHFHEAAVLGIDLGTTYSCIGFQKRGMYDKKTHKRETTIVVADKFRREYCIPTAIYFTKDENRPVIVGQDALKQLAKDPLNVIYDVKRIIGRSVNDIEVKNFNEKHSFLMSLDGSEGNKNGTDGSGDGYPKIIIPNRNNMKIAPEQALAVILAHLVEMASIEFEVPYIENVVVSVPAFFHNGQRKAVRSACSLVGLKAIQLVVEPTAAALAHSYYSQTPKDNFKLFLIFDFGGGTLDCSLVSCSGVDCRVLGVKGNSSLGGIDFDYIIADIMMQKFIKQHNWKFNNVMKTKFFKVAESVKKQLSEVEVYPVSMKNEEGMIQKIQMTRAEFENDPRTIELIDNAINIVKQALNDQDLTPSNVRMILMVGGTSKIPIVQQKIREVFYRDNLVISFPNDDPQLMVVKGSAIIGGSLAYDTLLTKPTTINVDNTNNNGEMDMDNSMDDDNMDGTDSIGHDLSSRVFVEDVIPLSLGFSICIRNYDGSMECGIMDPIVKKNSRYPTRASEVYCQRDPNSTVATLSLYEGDSRYTDENYFLGKLNITQIPPRTNDVCDSILVHFVIDKNGIATIEATVNMDGSGSNKTTDSDDNGKKNIRKYNTSLPVAADDGMLSKERLSQMAREMVGWFDNKEIKNILQSV